MPGQIGGDFPPLEGFATARRHAGAGERPFGRCPLFLPHTSRVPLLIGLSILTGLGLFVFTHLYPFTWQVDLNPVWGWTLCGMGLSVIVLSLLGFLWPPLEENWPALVFLCAIGLLIVVAGWDLEWALLLLSYLVRGLMYLASFALIGFGVWQVITIRSDSAKWSFAARYNQGYGAGHTKGYEEGYAKAYLNEHDSRYETGRAGGRIEGYEEGHSAGRAKGYTEGYTAGSANGFAHGYTQALNETQSQKYDDGYAEGRTENAARDRETRSFDPWQVLEVSSGSTQEEIKRAHRKQSKLYHPDKVAQLGKDLRDTAENKTKEINQAYEMIRKR